jgi:hypothetical protein
VNTLNSTSEYQYRSSRSGALFGGDSSPTLFRPRIPSPFSSIVSNQRPPFPFVNRRLCTFVRLARPRQTTNGALDQFKGMQMVESGPFGDASECALIAGSLTRRTQNTYGAYLQICLDFTCSRLLLRLALPFLPFVNSEHDSDPRIEVESAAHHFMIAFSGLEQAVIYLDLAPNQSKRRF